MKKSTDELTKILQSKKDYSEFIAEEYDELYFSTIGEYLTTLMAQKRLTKAEVIKRSNIDKHYAYQIFNNTKQNPSRDKLIMLSIGIGLNLDETNKLLKIASEANLYVRHPRDSVIMFCIQNHLSLIDTNERLYELSLQILE